MAKQTDVIKGMIAKALELQPCEAAMFSADLKTKVQHIASSHCKKHLGSAKFTSIQKGDTIYLLRIK